MNLRKILIKKKYEKLDNEFKTMHTYMHVYIIIFNKCTVLFGRDEHLKTSTLVIIINHSFIYIILNTNLV
jgi:hypothetical protein